MRITSDFFRLSVTPLFSDYVARASSDYLARASNASDASGPVSRNPEGAARPALRLAPLAEVPRSSGPSLSIDPTFSWPADVPSYQDEDTTYDLPPPTDWRIGSTAETVLDFDNGVSLNNVNFIAGRSELAPSLSGLDFRGPYGISAVNWGASGYGDTHLHLVARDSDGSYFLRADTGKNGDFGIEYTQPTGDLNAPFDGVKVRLGGDALDPVRIYFGNKDGDPAVILLVSRGGATRVPVIVLRSQTPDLYEQIKSINGLFERNNVAAPAGSVQIGMGNPIPRDDTSIYRFFAGSGANYTAIDSDIGIEGTSIGRSVGTGASSPVRWTLDSNGKITEVDGHAVAAMARGFYVPDDWGYVPNSYNAAYELQPGHPATIEKIWVTVVEVDTGGQYIIDHRDRKLTYAASLTMGDGLGAVSAPDASVAVSETPDQDQGRGFEGTIERVLDASGLALTVAGIGVSELDQKPLGPGLAYTVQGAFGSMTLGQDNTYRYVTSADVDPIPAGETRTDAFVYTLRQADGSKISRNLTVTITGADDVPKFTGATILTVNESSERDEGTSYAGQVGLGIDPDGGAIARVEGVKPGADSGSPFSRARVRVGDSDWNLRNSDPCFRRELHVRRKRLNRCARCGRSGERRLYLQRRERGRQFPRYSRG